MRRELDNGKLRRKCCECQLVKPITESESVLHQGLIEMEPTVLAKEILAYRAYIKVLQENEKEILDMTDRKKVLLKFNKATYSIKENTIFLSDGQMIAVTPFSLDGWVRKPVQNGSMISFSGKAADVNDSRLVDHIIVFVDEKFVHSTTTNVSRKDVSEIYKIS